MIRLRTVNNMLSVLVVILAIYIAFSPFATVAYVNYQHKKHTNPADGFVYQSKSAEENIGREAAQSLRPIPLENRLIIPRIFVDAEINEGATESALAKGPWRRPQTSTPEDGGNAVIVAHRYMYASGPKTFFFLDQMRVGDPIVIFWKGKEYDYRVSDVSVVAPTQLSIEAPTSSAQLTLYTCTPLWTASKRLVVKASLVQ